MTFLPGPTGVLGGTFDPVHLGHLAAARAACDAVGLENVLVVPSHQPPHRETRPLASPFHRFAMVSLAAAEDPRLVASDVELVAPGPSFTSVTLRVLHELGWPAWQLFFIIGTDAFAEIATWHEYPAVLDLTNFVVIARPGSALGSLPDRLPALAPRMHVVDGAQQARPGAGPTGIFLVSARTPDVSSTDVRALAARGESLDGLVPAAVERHIRRHGLYQNVPPAGATGCAR